MMHSNKLVVAIKVNGQVLRETRDAVALPFGCEYSILVKNLDSVRAQFSVSVDGKDATEGTRLILAPNSSLELERFIKSGNLNIGNRFKFIERTADIEAHKGIGSDDGLVRVEGWREHIQQFVDVPIVRHHYYDEWYPYHPYPWYHPVYPRKWLGASTSSGINSVTANVSGQFTNSSSVPTGARTPAPTKFRSFDSPEAERGDAGITVPGGESRQRFHHTRGFALEPHSTVIVLRLRGSIDGDAVAIPVTVNTKATCGTCGKVNKADAQFCSRCGTGLVIYA